MKSPCELVGHLQVVLALLWHSWWARTPSTLNPGGESLQSHVSLNPAAPDTMRNIEYQSAQLYRQVSTTQCVCPVMSDSLHPHGLQPSRLLRPRVFPGKSTGVVCHFLLLGIFLTMGSNSGIQGQSTLQMDSLLVKHQGNPLTSLNVWKPNLRDTQDLWG